MERRRVTFPRMYSILTLRAERDSDHQAYTAKRDRVRAALARRRGEGDFAAWRALTVCFGLSQSRGQKQEAAGMSLRDGLGSGPQGQSLSVPLGPS